MKPEQALHMFAINLLAATAKPDVVYYHIPNGERRDAATGAKLKRMGVVAGAPDLAFVLPPLGRAAFLELKSATGKQSKTQKEFEARSLRAGAEYQVASTPETVIGVLKKWGVTR
jgi:hypothetical protein